MRHAGKVTVLGLGLGVAMVVAGCSGGPATATERLWVSGVPTKPTQPLTAFVTMRTDEDRYLGAFFQGTVLRGQHDVFRWETLDKDRAQLEFLQDGRKVRLRLETCKPTTGFDYCLDVYGDPTGATRYQSRKRWVVRRPGRSRDATAGLFSRVVHELAEDDAELAAVLDAAAEAP